MTNSKTRAVIYARYSSSGQREESIEGQVRECTDYAQKCGYDVIRVYSDKALTGRTDKRPEFQRMILDAEKHLFDVLICWKIDRFARNRYDSAIYKNRLHKAGVSVQYARETISDGAEGIILESVLEGFAEYYSANLAENVKRGNYESVSCFKTMGKKVFGYRKGPDDTFIIDEATAPAVREVFNQYAAGRRIMEIVEFLNRNGYRNIKGKMFDKHSVRRILGNDKYIGTYRYKDFKAENAIPAIVPRETFDLCAERLKNNRHGPKNRNETRYLLTGKIFCAKCGEHMTGESARSKTGSLYYYYLCAGRKNHVCSKQREPKDEIETRVVSALIECVQDDEFINSAADACMRILEEEKTGGRLHQLQKQKEAVQRKINNLLSAVADGMKYETVSDMLLQLESEAKQIDEDIFTELQETPQITRNDVISLLKSYRAKPNEADERYKMRLIDAFLIAVYVDDDGGGYMLVRTAGNPRRVDLSEVREKMQNASLSRHSRTVAVSPEIIAVRMNAD